ARRRRARGPGGGLGPVGRARPRWAGGGGVGRGGAMGPGGGGWGNGGVRQRAYASPDLTRLTGPGFTFLCLLHSRMFLHRLSSPAPCWCSILISIGPILRRHPPAGARRPAKN